MNKFARKWLQNRRIRKMLRDSEATDWQIDVVMAYLTQGKNINSR